MAMITTWRYSTALAAIGLALTVPARAAGTAEAARPITVEHCARCHVVPEVNPASREPMPGAPAFQDIADDPATYTPARIRRFLRQPHYPMKAITLSPSDIDNLIAYFASLPGRPR